MSLLHVSKMYSELQGVGDKYCSHLELFYSNQENEWPFELILNCSSSPVLLPVVFLSFSVKQRWCLVFIGRWLFFFFLKVVFCFVVVANFLIFIALIISVSLDTWTIYSHPEIQALDLAKQELEQNSSLIQSANFPMLSLPCAQGQYLDLGFWTIFNPFLILS